MSENDNKSEANVVITEEAPFVKTNDNKPPEDHYSIVYLIFLLHGIGVLLPWNVFITIGADVCILVKIFLIYSKIWCIKLF